MNNQSSNFVIFSTAWAANFFDAASDSCTDRCNKCKYDQIPLSNSKTTELNQQQI